MVPVEYFSENVQRELVDAGVDLWREIMAKHMGLLVWSQAVAWATTSKQYGA